MKRYYVTLLIMLATLGVFSSAVAASLLIVDKSAAVSKPAQRVEMRHSNLLFPIETSPQCEIVNGFGAYSKTYGSGGHQGLDIGGQEGQEVYAVESGELYRQFEGSNSGLGWGLHSLTDVKYRYFHLQSLAEGLAVGDFVEVGQVIGYVGDTGNATKGGWHLHFEVRPGPDYKPVDPYPLLAPMPTACKDSVGPSKSDTATTTSTTAATTTRPSTTAATTTRPTSGSLES